VRNVKSLKQQKQLQQTEVKRRKEKQNKFKERFNNSVIITVNL